MSKRLSVTIRKTKMWGIGFYFEVWPNVTLIILAFTTRTLIIRFRTKAQLIEQKKRSRALADIRLL